MAKPKTLKLPLPSTLPPWAQPWPRTGDVVSWMNALLAVAAFIEDPEEHRSVAVLAMGMLAKLGRVDEAIAHANRFAEELPAAHAQLCIYWHVQAAELWLDRGGVEEARACLNRAEAQRVHLKKAAAARLTGQLQAPLWRRGLLDPDVPVEARDRRWAGLYRHMRLARSAANEDREAARRHAMAAMSWISDWEGWELVAGGEHLIRLLKELGFADLLEQVLAKDDEAVGHAQISYFALIAVDERERAIRRMEAKFQEDLAELRKGTMNAHSHAGSIHWVVHALVGLGERDRAQRLLRLTHTESTTWRLRAPGAFNSAVYRSLAQATLEVEGADAARLFFERALGETGQEASTHWRKGADRDNVRFLAQLDGPEAAIELAARIRSKSERRQCLADLLAQMKRWDDLHGVINSAATPLEAAQIIWWSGFQWREA